MSTCGFKQEHSGKCIYLFIVLHELHLMKGPDTEAIFSVVCSSDIREQQTQLGVCDIRFGQFDLYKQLRLARV